MTATITYETYPQGSPGWWAALDVDGMRIAHGPGPAGDLYPPPVPRRPCDREEGRTRIWELTPDDVREIISRVKAGLQRPQRDTDLDTSRRAVLAALGA